MKPNDLPGSGPHEPEKDLTSRQSDYVRKAIAAGNTFITQPYDLYSPRNHRSWQMLCATMKPLWERHAAPEYLEGLERSPFDRSRVPAIADLNHLLRPYSDFRMRSVVGYISAPSFFECLYRAEFPTAISVRDISLLPGPPETDLFHDVAGHLPWLTDSRFAAALSAYGGYIYAIRRRSAGCRDDVERKQRMASAVRALARFFWYTLEVGLVNTPSGSKALGAVLLTCPREIGRSLENPRVTRRPFCLEEVIHQPYFPDAAQPRLYVVDSLHHLYDLMREVGDWLDSGKLDEVDPGEPSVSEDDLRALIHEEPRNDQGE